MPLKVECGVLMSLDPLSLCRDDFEFCAAIAVVSCGCAVSSLPSL
jgi:hypothetical protein